MRPPTTPLPAAALHDDPDASAPITLRYLERFACTGAACEANCCAGQWSIPIDEKHYDKLKRAMSGSRSERDAFRAAVHLEGDPARRSPGRHALLVLDDKGACRLLESDGLCSVHRRHGEAALPDTCALYPRMLSRIGARLELTATVSCPEAARQLLLHDDGAQLVMLDPRHLPRRPAAVQVELAASPYARHVDEVRSTVLRLLARVEYPIATRLFFITFLGQRTAPYFHVGAAEDDPGQLASDLARVDRPEILDELARHYAEVSIPTGLAETVALEVLRARLTVVQEDFRALVARAAAGYGFPGDDVDGAALVAAYRARRDALPAWARARLDGYLTRYAINHWMRRIYLFSPSLLAHAQGLSLWIAMIKLLLLGQPAARAALDSDDETQRVRQLDAAAVEVFFRFARALEHSPNFVAAVERRMDELGLRTFAHAVALTTL